MINILLFSILNYYVKNSIFAKNQKNDIWIIFKLNYSNSTLYKLMVIITLQRKKCIGCNYCVELAPKQFQMSKKDGKAVLLHTKNKKSFFTLKSPDMSIFENVSKAKEACPAKIISVKLK